MIKKLFATLLLLFGACSVCATEPTNYPYWIEDTGNGNYNIWTKVSIPANGEKTIYIKKVDGYSPNGDDVFEFFVENKIISQGTYLKSNNKFNSPIILEARVKPTNTMIGMVGFVGDTVLGEDQLPYGSGDGATHTYWIDGYDWYQTMNDGGYAQPSPNEGRPAYSTTEYQKLYILWKPNKVEWKYNGGYDYIYTDVSRIPDEPLWGYIGAWSDGDWDVDYLFVRKYADQEPSVQVEQINDNTWKVTINNPNNQDLTDFQVKIDGTGIVGSKTDSLLLTDEINPQYLTLTTPDIWNINSPVNATVSGNNISQGTIIYLDWGDGVIDNQIYNGDDLQFQHTYSETGTYTIKAYVNTSITTEKQIIITENLTTGILTFKPLYENTTITGWAIVNGMNVSMAKNATIYGILNEPVKIQTDKGYMTSIPFSADMTAYIAGNEYQYVTVSLSADNPITVKNGDKIVGYGKNVYITQPVGDTITVWCNNKKIREYLLRSSIDDYIYIPKQHITANIRENNGILAVYLETWRKEKLHIQVETNNTAIYETEGYYEGFQRIDTGITPEAGNTYKLTILNEEGNVVSYSTYTYTPETEKPDIPEQEGYIWIAFIIGVIIMIMGVISDNLPIALIGVGLFVLLVPYHMPYLDHLASISTALAIIIIISRHIKRNAGE